MGFKKENAIREIRVALAYETRNHDTGLNETSDVEHIFNFPTTKQREIYQQKSVKWKGRKAKTTGSEASWYLWNACIIRVNGYDDLPADTERGGLITYFKDDDVCRLHVEDAVSSLWELIGAEDGDFTKKSEPSSEE